MAIRHYEGEIIIFESQKYPPGEAWKKVKKRVDKVKESEQPTRKSDDYSLEKLRGVDKRAVMLFATVVYFFLSTLH